MSDIELRLARHLPAVRAFVRLQMGPAVRASESSSDIVQSACLVLLRGGEAAVPADDRTFRQWLCRAALNKLRDHLRRDHAVKRNAGGVEPLHDGSRLDADVVAFYRRMSAPGDRLMGAEEALRVEAALDRLPEHYREVVLMARLLEMSNAEIAERTQRSEDSVRNVLHRALVELSRLLLTP